MKGIHILFSILFLFWLFVFCLIIYIYIFAPESTREDEKRRAIARLSLKHNEQNRSFNPIAEPIRPTSFQLKSTGFKEVQESYIKGFGYRIKVIDNKGYCYYISSKYNYLQSWVSATYDAKDNPYGQVTNILKLEYVYAQIQEPSGLAPFNLVNKVEEQYKLLTQGSKIDRCSRAPLVSLISVKFRLDGVPYEFQASPQEIQKLSQQTVYIF